MSNVYSGHVNANDGFASPAAFDGPTGWTVFKAQQTEIYKITHNLHLTNPAKQLHVVVMPETINVGVTISQSADVFTVTTLRHTNSAAVATPFAFIAVHYPTA
jgi:hypothetical protein